MSIPSPYREWVTLSEFSRIMGRSPEWAYKYAKLGHFADFGIPVLLDKTSHSRLGGASRRWYFSVPGDMIN
jgi:hypothetical protein